MSFPPATADYQPYGNDREESSNPFMAPALHHPNNTNNMNRTNRAGMTNRPFASLPLGSSSGAGHPIHLSSPVASPLKPLITNPCEELSDAGVRLSGTGLLAAAVSPQRHDEYYSELMACAAEELTRQKTVSSSSDNTTIAAATASARTHLSSSRIGGPQGTTVLDTVHPTPTGELLNSVYSRDNSDMAWCVTMSASGSPRVLTASGTIGGGIPGRPSGEPLYRPPTVRLVGASQRFPRLMPNLEVLLEGNPRVLDLGVSHETSLLTLTLERVLNHFAQNVEWTAHFSHTVLWLCFSVISFVLMLCCHTTRWCVLPSFVGIVVLATCVVRTWLSKGRAMDSVLLWSIHLIALVLPIANHLILRGFHHSGGVVLTVGLTQLLTQTNDFGIPHHHQRRCLWIHAYFGWVALILALVVIGIEPLLGLERWIPEPPSTLLAYLFGGASLLLIVLSLRISLRLNAWQLAQSQQTAQLFAPGACAAVDREGVVLHCTSQFNELFGLSMVGKTCHSFLAERKSERMAKWVVGGAPEWPNELSSLDVAAGGGGEDGGSHNGLLLTRFMMKSIFRLMAVRIIPYKPGVRLIELFDLSDCVDPCVDRVVLSGLLSAMNESLLLTDEHQEIVGANLAAQRTFQVTEEELLGKSLHSLLSQRKEDLSSSVTPCPTLSGLRTFLVRLQTLQPPTSPLYNAGGRLLDGLLNTMANGVIMADESMKILRVNPAACRLFGFEEHELVGKVVNTLMSAEIGALHIKWVERYFRTGKASVIGSCGRSVTGRQKDGTPIALSFTLSECVMPDGARLFSAIFHDRRPEVEAERANLVKKVTEAQLDTQQQFTQYLFHVLRNPLNGVSKGVELVTAAMCATQKSAEERLAGAQLELEAVIDSIAETLHIMDNLMDVYNLQSGKEFLANVPFSLSEQLKHTANCVRHLVAPDVTMHMSFADDEGDLQLLGSPYHIQQVLVNLLTNACQYTKQGFIELGAHVLHQTEKEFTVQIQVADTGVGLSEQQRTLVLRSRDSIALRIGTGLGLTIVQNLVRLMGGTLRVNSPWKKGVQHPLPQESSLVAGSSSISVGMGSEAPQKHTDIRENENEHVAEAHTGSLFYFTVTFQKVQGLARTTTTSSASAETSTLRGAGVPPSLPSNMSVLVVDDLPLNRRLWRIIFTSGPFQSLHWRIDDVEDGETALQKIQQDGKIYDIVVFDEHLGPNKKRGREVTKILRVWEAANELSPTMIFIGASANCTNEDREQAMQSGQDLFYGKPYPSADKVYKDVGVLIQQRLVRHDQQFCHPLELDQVCNVSIDPAPSGAGPSPSHGAAARRATLHQLLLHHTHSSPNSTMTMLPCLASATTRHSSSNSSSQSSLPTVLPRQNLVGGGGGGGPIAPSVVVLAPTTSSILSSKGPPSPRAGGAQDPMLDEVGVGPSSITPSILSASPQVTASSPRNLFSASATERRKSSAGAIGSSPSLRAVPSSVAGDLPGFSSHQHHQHHHPLAASSSAAGIHAHRFFVPRNHTFVDK